SNVFVVDIASGKSTNLTPHEGEHTYGASDISPDGKQILITSDAHNGYDNVGLLDLGAKKIEWLTSEKWEIDSGTFSPDGKSLNWIANIDGSTVIYSYDIVGRRAEPLSIATGVNALGGDLRPYTRDGSRLLYYHNASNAPSDLWVYDIASKQSQQITH